VAGNRTHVFGGGSPAQPDFSYPKSCCTESMVAICLATSAEKVLARTSRKAISLSRKFQRLRETLLRVAPNHCDYVLASTHVGSQPFR